MLGRSHCLCLTCFNASNGTGQSCSTGLSRRFLIIYNFGKSLIYIEQFNLAFVRFEGGVIGRVVDIGRVHF